MGFAAQGIACVDLSDDVSAEDHFTDGLDFGFIIPGGVLHDLTQGGMVIEAVAFPTPPRICCPISDVLFEE